jgi:enterochelin esterase-like enzyme
MSYGKVLGFVIGLTSVIALGVGCGAAPTSAPQPATPTPQPAGPTPRPTVVVKSEKITSQALAGNLLGDPAERTVYVLLPPDYATSDKRYPVIYVMPGSDGEPGQFAWGFKEAMEARLRQGESAQMIVAVPDGTNKLGGSLFKSSPTIGDYETYATQEVVGYVDTHFRTLPARDSRGLAGCSNGGTISMRLGLKYPNVFSVLAPSSGIYDDTPQPEELAIVQRVTKLPQDFAGLSTSEMQWYVMLAAGSAPDPNSPPFYCEMPVRIVNGHGEFVPEVMAKIAEQDAMHEARRYAQQPVRLRGFRIWNGSLDAPDLVRKAHSFDQLLTDLGIEHEYVEEKAVHCAPGWEAATLKYMADKLVFEK